MVFIEYNVSCIRNIAKRKILVVGRAVWLLNIAFWRSRSRKRALARGREKSGGEEFFIYRPIKHHASQSVLQVC